MLPKLRKDHSAFF